MKLFGAVLSPFVRKVALVAREKGLEYDLARFRNREGNLPEFLACSPFGKIPAIDDGGFKLSDSTAIALYLDSQYPAVPLIPQDPKLRGRTMWFDEFNDTILAAAGLKILFNRIVGPKFFNVPGDEAMAQQGERELPGIFAWLESVAPADGWLLGEMFTLADVAVAASLRTLSFIGQWPRADCPRTLDWYDRVTARPSWQAVLGEELPLPA